MILTQDLLFTLFFNIILSFILLYFLTTKGFLIDQINSSKHKQLTADNSTQKIILCGGIIIFTSISIFFTNDLYLVKIFSFLILIIGILSDINKLNSPKYRILFQILIVLFFLLINEDLAIVDLRVILINNILEIKFISILFTVFCMLILINGSNFLDGLNTLVIGYYILVLTIIVLTSYQFNLEINLNIYSFINILLVVFLFNFFNKIYLGDAGSYFISFLTSFFILDFFLKNDSISPYFICLLLWYPAFENLFSILRRSLSKKQKKVQDADQDHLHQIIYKYFISFEIVKNKYVNSLTANIINLYNMIIFIFFIEYINNTKFLLLGIIFNISIYLVLYFFIKIKLKNKNHKKFNHKNA